MTLICYGGENEMLCKYLMSTFEANCYELSSMTCKKTMFKKEIITA